MMKKAKEMLVNPLEMTKNDQKRRKKEKQTGDTPNTGTKLISDNDKRKRCVLRRWIRAFWSTIVE